MASVFELSWALARLRARQDMRMTKRGSELRESSAPGPFITMERERGTVEIWALGGDRYEIRAPGEVQETRGHDAAEELADRLAEQLGPAVYRG
jgi:hypothetical protein